MQLLFTIIDYLINEAINDNYNDVSVKKFIMQSSEYIKGSVLVEMRTYCFSKKFEFILLKQYVHFSAFNNTPLIQFSGET